MEVRTWPGKLLRRPVAVNDMGINLFAEGWGECACAHVHRPWACVHACVCTGQALGLP